MQSIAMGMLRLQPAHLPNHPIRHFDAAHQHQQVKDQLTQIAPNHGDGTGAGIDGGWGGGEGGKNDAGQYDHRAFQAYGGIGAKKGFADAAGGFSRKGGKGHRGDGRIKV